ncbi:MAG: adenine phosphoribosyltransferase [Actinomycetes bacterium]
MPDVETLLRSKVRDVPDYPKPGVMFRDITPVLADPTAFSTVVDAIVALYGRGTIDQVVGVEARGFILAAPVAYHFCAGFVPVRKIGKLPHTTFEQSYELEYGNAVLEIHQDALRPGQRVLVVDDVLATGGTAAATVELVRRTGADVVGAAFMIELEFLHGRERLPGVSVDALLHY